ncbi:MAG: glycosyltransferase family 4 protein [Firmicutes bacterium]|nr:glycosyltransferase family 4 protein [Bacillota bacterium]
MRVLIISPVAKMAAGGVAAHVATLEKMLKQHGVDSQTIVLDIDPSLGIRFYAYAGFRKMLNKIHEPWGFMVSDKIAEMKLAKSLQSVETFDLIHCHSKYADIVRKIVGNKVPIVLTVHGYIADEAVSRRTVKRGSIGYRYLERNEYATYASANAIICVDQRIAKHVSARVSYSVPTWVVPNAVDTSVFCPSDDQSFDRYTILCPRMLNPKNGVDVAIRAMEFLKQHPRLPAVRMIIAGDGRQRRQLESYVHENDLKDVVTFFGTVSREEMPKLMRKCGVVIIPSIPSEGVEEATSIAVLEAMASGVPVVASAIGGLREIVIDGETGFLVPPGEPDRLANAIIMALKQRETLSKKAVQYVNQHFSIEAMGRKVLDVYASVK